MKTFLTMLLLTLPAAAQGVKPGPVPVKPISIPTTGKTTPAESVRESAEAWHVTTVDGVERSVPKSFGRDTAVRVCRECAADARKAKVSAPCPCGDVCPCPAGQCGSAACPTAKAVPSTVSPSVTQAPKSRIEYRTRVTGYTKQCGPTGCTLVPQTVTEAVRVPVE